MTGPSRGPGHGSTVAMLAAALASLLWVLSVVSLVLVAAGHGAADAGGWFFQAVFTAFATPALWLWWRQLAERRQHDEPRPPELDERPGPHLGLSGETPPPKRW